LAYFRLWNLRRKHMIDKITLMAIAATAALAIALPTVASAQSEYTSGTVAGDTAAGYPSPYGYGNGLYSYAPDYGHSHAAQGRQHRGRDAGEN
jgi:hypothetical protein